MVLRHTVLSAFEVSGLESGAKSFSLASEYLQNKDERERCTKLAMRPCAVPNSPTFFKIDNTSFSFVQYES